MSIIPFHTFIYKLRSKLCFYFQKVNSTITQSQLNRHGENCFIGFPIEARGLSKVEIGNNVRIVGPCRIEAIEAHNGEKFTPLISIGNNVNIEAKSHIGAIDSITIEDNVLMGSNILITDHAHGNICDIHMPPIKRPLYSKGSIKIEHDCWLGENCVILSGVTLGHHSIVGAGAIVTKSCPPYSVLGGNPAHIIKTINI